MQFRDRDLIPVASIVGPSSNEEQELVDVFKVRLRQQQLVGRAVPRSPLPRGPRVLNCGGQTAKLPRPTAEVRVQAILAGCDVGGASIKPARPRAICGCPTSRGWEAP
jgi:hypothetical protein